MGAASMPRRSIVTLRPRPPLRGSQKRRWDRRLMATDPATTEGEYVVAGEKDSLAAHFAGSGGKPRRRQASWKRWRISCATGPVACMRVPKSGSLSRSPRMPRTIDITCAARSGKCSASHSRNRSFTSHGSRSKVYPASDAPASRLASSTASISCSVSTGMMGATSTPTGTPASASTRIAFSFAPAEAARGSSMRFISLSSVGMLNITRARSSRAS